MRTTLTALLLAVVISGCTESPAKVHGRVFAERADDVAWENDKVAFRAYGPATQAKGERAYGYDIFFKYPDKGLVLETLYGEECSSANWAKVDSLRKIDQKLAHDCQQSFTYHVDHGFGMDCYAVGPTLGAGVAAIVNEGDSTIYYPWCYERAEILEDGPTRFAMRLTFAPRTIDSDTAVVETRTITLDEGSHLNHCTVEFAGLSTPQTIAVGFPLRDDHPTFTDTQAGIVAYSDPTTGSDNGRALLGAIVPGGLERTATIDKHILGLKTLNPGEAFDYWFGFAWDRTDIREFADWVAYLRNFTTSE